jgi:hypothetical protein
MSTSVLASTVAGFQREAERRDPTTARAIRSRDPAFASVDDRHRRIDGGRPC